MNDTYQGRDCGDASGEAMCTRPAGHPGAHYDATVGLTWTAGDPPAGLLPRVDELTARLGAAFKASALLVALESVEARIVDAEHAANCEDALTRIADMARQALDARQDDGDTYGKALERIIAVTEESNR
jgi:hypothetical protein